MKSKTSPPWFPLWIDKWLFGSTRYELQPDERSVWVDLMALSWKDGGYVRANAGIPYPSKQLAGMLNIDVELLLRTVEKCKDCGKVIEGKDGTFYLPSFEEYKLTARHQRRFDFDVRK
jgi:hypothetical protein